MVDPYLVTTVIAGLTAIGLGCERIILKSNLNGAAAQAKADTEIIAFWKAKWRATDVECAKLLVSDAARRAHLKRIASLGAKASNAKRKGVRKVAIAKTIAAMPALTLRPRDEVVAGVREARAAKKNPAQSVAAK